MENFPFSESSWIPERYFNNMEIINKYFDQLKSNNISERPKRTRTIKKLNF